MAEHLDATGVGEHGKVERTPSACADGVENLAQQPVRLVRLAVGHVEAQVQRPWRHGGGACRRWTNTQPRSRMKLLYIVEDERACALSSAE